MLLFLFQHETSTWIQCTSKVSSSDVEKYWDSFNLFLLLFSHLYRSSSFNSSGRSSNCDTNEDMYSDISLEEVPDLNHKLELLQRQITNLADTQMNSDDRTSRAKTENAVLQTKYEMLEETLRETELRAEERLVEEQKRYRELLARVEREAELKNENCQIRIQTIEMEVIALRNEIHRLK